MRHIIFDFDGTLADSLPIVIDIAKKSLNIELNNNQIERLRNMSAKQVLKEVRIPIYKVPSLLIKGRPLLQKRMGDVKVFSGLSKVVKTLFNDDYRLYVVSSNSVGIINRFLGDNNLRQYFSGVYGNVGIFSKAQALKKVMKREGFSVENSVYVGDEVRDIEAAKKIKMSIISVTWGYNGKKVLSSYEPDYLAESPSDLLKFINEKTNS